MNNYINQTSNMPMYNGYNNYRLPTYEVIKVNGRGGATMLQAYSINVDVAADSIVPFNNVSVDKGCAEELTGVGTIELEKAGIYVVHVDASVSTATTIQLIRNGVPLPQAQSTGTSLSFTTYVQVEGNNCNCNCRTSPVTIQLHNLTGTVFDNVNIVVRKAG